MNARGAAATLLSRLGQLRESAGIPESELEGRLILGPGRIESGEGVPGLDTSPALSSGFGADLPALTVGIESGRGAGIDRRTTAEDGDGGLLVRFGYGKFDSEYLLPDANPSDVRGFVASRAYADPFKHPAEFARRLVEQLDVDDRSEADKAAVRKRGYSRGSSSVPFSGDPRRPQQGGW